MNKRNLNRIMVWLCTDFCHNVTVLRDTNWFGMNWKRRLGICRTPPNGAQWTCSKIFGYGFYQDVWTDAL